MKYIYIQAFIDKCPPNIKKVLEYKHACNWLQDIIDDINHTWYMHPVKFECSSPLLSAPEHDYLLNPVESFFASSSVINRETQIIFDFVDSLCEEIHTNILCNNHLLSKINTELKFENSTDPNFIVANSKIQDFLIRDLVNSISLQIYILDDTQEYLGFPVSYRDFDPELMNEESNKIFKNLLMNYSKSVLFNQIKIYQRTDLSTINEPVVDCFNQHKFSCVIEYDPVFENCSYFQQLSRRLELHYTYHYSSFMIFFDTEEQKRLIQIALSGVAEKYKKYRFVKNTNLDLWPVNRNKTFELAKKFKTQIIEHAEK